MVHRVRASHHVLIQPHVFNGARESAVVPIHVESARWLARHSAMGSFKADDAIEGGGDPD